jgi:hypothetical protein
MHFCCRLKKGSLVGENGHSPTSLDLNAAQTSVYIQRPDGPNRLDLSAAYSFLFEDYSSVQSARRLGRMAFSTH